MGSKRRLVVIWLLATLVFTLTACGGGKKAADQPAAPGASGQQSAQEQPKPAKDTEQPEETETTGEAKENKDGGGKTGGRKKIVIAFPSAGSLSVLPIAAAERQGYYKEEGFEIEFTEMKPPVAIPAVVAGEIDYVTALASGITASMQGIPIRTVLVVTAKPMHYLVAKKEIGSVQDLKGKMVAVNAVGDLTDAELREGLKKAGMQYSDVKVIAISGASQKIAAMDSGQVEAAVLEVPHNILAVEKGYKQLMSFADVLPAGTGGLATSTNKLQENPDEVLRVV